MVRQRICEPGRYYDDERLIVMRRGLLVSEERRYLWHELVHADRHDRACHAGHATEQAVEREAARRAMPRSTLLWAMTRAEHWWDLAELLKVPEPWVKFRWRTLCPADREYLVAAQTVHPVHITTA